MSDGTWEIPGEVLYPSIKPPPPGVPVNALAATQILLDLIAELRAAHKQGNWCEMRCCSSCVHCVCSGWPCGEIEAADRAEARLREIGGGDADV